MSAELLLNPRVCELGKIKIGGLGASRKSSGGGTYRLPEKHDHFTITTLQRNGTGDLAPDAPLMKALADGGFADPDGKIRRLPVVLLSHSIPEVLQVAYLWFNGKKLAGLGDGEKLTLFFDRQKNEWFKKPIETDWDPDVTEWKDPKGNRLFKLHTTLNCVIASPAARWGGYYKFRTTSVISGNQLYGSLLHVRQLTGGVLRGVPFELVVRPMQVAPEGIVSTVYVVHLEIVGSDLAAIQGRARDQVQLELSTAKQVAASRVEYLKALKAPDEFDDDSDEEETAAEFHPPAGTAGKTVPGEIPPDEFEKQKAAEALAAEQAARLAQARKETEPLAGDGPPPKTNPLANSDMVYGDLIGLLDAAKWKDEGEAVRKKGNELHEQLTAKHKSLFKAKLDKRLSELPVRPATTDIEDPDSGNDGYAGGEIPFGAGVREGAGV